MDGRLHYGSVGCGDGIRTPGLGVMSAAFYRAELPRVTVAIFSFQASARADRLKGWDSTWDSETCLDARVDPSARSVSAIEPSTWTADGFDFRLPHCRRGVGRSRLHDSTSIRLLALSRPVGVRRRGRTTDRSAPARVASRRRGSTASARFRRARTRGAAGRPASASASARASAPSAAREAARSRRRRRPARRSRRLR